MNYEYKLLTQDERDEMLAQTLKAQETDLFMHTSNKERFLEMIDLLPEDNLFRKKLEKEIEVIDSRLIEVSTIIETLEHQLPDNQRLQAAMTRIKERDNNRTSV
jgi:hypothetical protein